MMLEKPWRMVGQHKEQSDIQERPVDHAHERTDADRMEEYAETGEPDCLTPALALQMRVSAEVMKEVPGATKEDIDSARQYEREDEREVQAEEDALIAKYAGVEDYATLSPEEQMRALLTVASLRASDHHDELSDLKEAVLDRLSDRVLFEQEGAYRLADLLRYNSPEGIKDLHGLEQVYEHIHRRFIHLSHEPNLLEEEKTEGQQCAAALNEFVDVFKGFYQGEFIDGTSYLFAKRAFDLAAGELLEDKRADPDDYLPFEVIKGRFAVFSESRDRLYIAPPEDASTIRKEVARMPKPRYQEQGQFFARHTAIELPQRAVDLKYDIMDASPRLEEVVSGLGVSPADLDDYVSMQRSGIRSIIEQDFGVPLKELTFREQFHLLEFLKTVPVEKANEVAEFTSSYGLDALRTFLVTTRDEALRESVFDFTRTAPKEEVPKVFAAYGSLVGKIDEVGDYLRVQFGSEHNEEAITAVVERLLARARGVLEQAAQLKNEPERLLEVVDSVKAENTIFLESFKALKKLEGITFEQVKDLQFERLRATDIAEQHPDLAEQMRELYTKCHGHEDPEYLARLIERNEERMQDPNSFFYLLTYQGKLIGMMRFDEKYDENGKLFGMYAGGLNVDPDFNGGRVGDEIIEKTFALEKKRGVPIDAHVRTSSPLALRYLSGEWIADGIERLEGTDRFHIVLHPARNEYLASKRAAMDVDVMVARAGTTEENVRYVRYESLPDTFPAKFGILTRLARRDNAYYAVFESEESPLAEAA